MCAMVCTLFSWCSGGGNRGGGVSAHCWVVAGFMGRCHSRVMALRCPTKTIELFLVTVHLLAS